jgi:glycosyltransferase involved in cell wall biosynthesis
VIVDDGDGDMLTPEGEFWLEAIAKNQSVSVIKGARINQCYSHNHVLWSEGTSELILRIDDDLIPDRDFLEVLVSAWQERQAAGIRVGAISGVYFDQRQVRGDNPPIPTSYHYDTTVHRDGTAFAVAQMVEYSDDNLIEAEHLYSACLYSRDAMRSVGGWPLVYSDGVAHREETDGTHRLFLAGHKLYICPGAKAKHEHGEGGIRSMTPAEHAERRAADEKRWMRRIYKLRGVNYKPRVAVASYHTYGIGGAQRLYYSLVSALQDMDIFERVVPIPLGKDRLLDTRDEIKERYGLKVTDLGERDDGVPWRLVEFDIVITLGHEPPKPVELPPRRHHIHYNLFPTLDQGLPTKVDRYVSISLYSGEALKMAYRRNPEVIYPFVREHKMTDGLRKENEIVLVGDVRRSKRISEMAEAFLGMDLPEGTKLNIVTPFLSESNEDAQYLMAIAQDPRVELYSEVSDRELRDIYLRSKILWAARGHKANPATASTTFEHFGYTPVEAVMHYCIPLAFDAGGYKETAYVRWKTVEELEAATKRLLEDAEEAKRVLAINVGMARQFSYERFQSDWTRVIMALNSFAWEPDINEWRRTAPEVEVVDGGLHIACVSDSPYRPSGYGLIAREVYAGFMEQGWKTHVFALEDHRGDIDGLYHRYWPNPLSSDRLDTNFQEFIKSHRVDAAVVIRDVYTGARFISGVRNENAVVPIIAYVSQEGLPIHRDWIHVLAWADEVITYAACSSEAVEIAHDKKVDWVHLGADHAGFMRYDDADRDLLRQRLGWNDRFVILNVSRNVGNKRLPALMKTVKVLKDDFGYAPESVVLALHTEMMGRAVLGGHDLKMWNTQLDLGTELAISPDLKLDYSTDLEQVLQTRGFASYAERKEWFSKLGMVGFYNAADVYVDVSAAEGFGLPNLEAQACGVPVISVDDGYVRSEVIGDSALMIKPSETPAEWVTGADLWLVDPRAVAERIDYVKMNPGFARDIADSGLENSKRFKWDTVREKMVEAVKSCQRKW